MTVRCLVSTVQHLSTSAVTGGTPVRLVTTHENWYSLPISSVDSDTSQARGRESVSLPAGPYAPTTDRWLPHKTTHMKSEPTNTLVKIRNELCNRRALECDAFHHTYKQHLPRLLAVQLYPCGIYKQQFTIKSQHINHEHSSTVPV